MKLFGRLLCPTCKNEGMRVVTAHAPADEPLPESGYAVCNHCNTRYPIREHILDLASHATYPLTVAGRSNLAPFAPQIYEKVWRPRALSLLTGKKFPPTLELARLREWAQVKVGDLVLDVGTSTGFYARGLATVDAEIVALDHARGMLQTARAVARRKGFNRLAYLRAFAQALPFADAGVDVIVCGGSLNEFASMAGALREMRRVLKADGRIVTMSLLAAPSTPGRLAQQFFGMSGIRFPTRAAFNALVHEVGLKPVQQQADGIVLFSQMEHAAQSSSHRRAGAPVLEIAHR